MQYARDISQFVIEEFLPDVPAHELDPHLDLIEKGVIDSLGLLKLLAWIEERYDLSEDVMPTPEDLRTVAAIDAFVATATADGVRAT